VCFAISSIPPFFFYLAGHQLTPFFDYPFPTIRSCLGRNSNGRLGLGIGNGPIHPGQALGQVPLLAPVDLRPNVFGGSVSPPSTDPAFATLDDTLGVISGFCPSVTTYGPIAVDADTAATVTLSASCRAAGCTMSANVGPAVPLIPGTNVISVVSTSASGTRSATYTITILVAAATSSSTLRSLWDSLEATVAPGASELNARAAFDPAVTTYPTYAPARYIAWDVDAVEIAAACTVVDCRIEIFSTAHAPASQPLYSGTGSAPAQFAARPSVTVPLSPNGGVTTVQVRVTSSDLGSTTDYTLHFEAGCTASFLENPTAAVAAVASGASDVAWDMGNSHTCVLRDGEAVCYGEGTNGRLGRDSSTTHGNAANEVVALTPINFGTTNPAISVSAGSTSTCVIFAKDPDAATTELRCFGYNGYGQLGQGDTVTRGNGAGETSTLATVDFGPSLQPAQVSVGEHHVCTLFSNGRVLCHGRFTHGQLLTGSRWPATNVGNVLGDIRFGERVVSFLFFLFFYFIYFFLSLFVLSCFENILIKT
jgi:hypothetical protein